MSQKLKKVKNIKYNLSNGKMRRMQILDHVQLFRLSLISGTIQETLEPILCQSAITHITELQSHPV